ncbi:MAG TPA: hypothetical protein VJV78_21645 [Polyangiales bacterium]|nr:hypothetical protein [Polyangiales bacterium]
MHFGRAPFWFACAWIAGCCIALGACGDDDGDKPKPDDGGVDASTDSGGNFIPRPDASVATTDPIRTCDRFDPNSCPSGQTCDLIARVVTDSSGQQGLSVYTGCVDKARERGLGDPCDPDFTTTPPYRTKGLTDLVFRDQCGPGLICGSDPKVRGGTSCQPMCSSGAFEAPVLCSDPKSFCVGSDQFMEFCLPSDGCDPTYQTGCPTGQACYLRPKDDLSGFLSVCFPPAAKLLADGAACNAYNVCKPGSSCNGPLRLPLDQWQQKDLACRPSCTADGVVPNAEQDSDGGADDGGTATGGCPSPTKCAPFSKSGLDLAGISKAPYGQCE